MNRHGTVSLAQWLALTPRELVQAHLKVDRALLDALRKEKMPVIPGGSAAGEESGA